MFGFDGGGGGARLSLSSRRVKVGAAENSLVAQVRAPFPGGFTITVVGTMPAGLKLSGTMLQRTAAAVFVGQLLLVKLRAEATDGSEAAERTFLLVGVPGGAEDVTAPVITSPNAFTQPENAAWSVTLTANEAVTWSKRTGSDSALFTLSGAALSLPPQDYEGRATPRVCLLLATDAAGNETPFAVTVTIADVQISASGTPAPATINTAYPGFRPTVSGGRSPFSYAADPMRPAPAGLAIDGTNGLVGTPTALFSGQVGMIITDADGEVAPFVFTLTVAEQTGPTVIYSTTFDGYTGLLKDMPGWEASVNPATPLAADNVTVADGKVTKTANANGNESSAIVRPIASDYFKVEFLSQPAPNRQQYAICKNGSSFMRLQADSGGFYRIIRGNYSDMGETAGISCTPGTDRVSIAVNRAVGTVVIRNETTGVETAPQPINNSGTELGALNNFGPMTGFTNLIAVGTDVLTDLTITDLAGQAQPMPTITGTPRMEDTLVFADPAGSTVTARRLMSRPITSDMADPGANTGIAVSAGSFTLDNATKQALIGSELSYGVQIDGTWYQSAWTETVRARFTWALGQGVPVVQPPNLANLRSTNTNHTNNAIADLDGATPRLNPGAGERKLLFFKAGDIRQDIEIVVLSNRANAFDNYAELFFGRQDTGTAPGGFKVMIAPDAVIVHRITGSGTYFLENGENLSGVPGTTGGVIGVNRKGTRFRIRTAPDPKNPNNTLITVFMNGAQLGTPKSVTTDVALGGWCGVSLDGSQFIGEISGYGSREGVVIADVSLERPNYLPGEMAARIVLPAGTTEAEPEARLFDQDGAPLTDWEPTTVETIRPHTTERSALSPMIPEGRSGQVVQARYRDAADPTREIGNGILIPTDPTPKQSRYGANLGDPNIELAYANFAHNLLLKSAPDSAPAKDWEISGPTIRVLNEEAAGMWDGLTYGITDGNHRPTMIPAGRNLNLFMDSGTLPDDPNAYPYKDENGSDLWFDAYFTPGLYPVVPGYAGGANRVVEFAYDGGSPAASVQSGHALWRVIYRPRSERNVFAILIDHFDPQGFTAPSMESRNRWQGTGKQPPADWKFTLYPVGASASYRSKWARPGYATYLAPPLAAGFIVRNMSHVAAYYGPVAEGKETDPYWISFAGGTVAFVGRRITAAMLPKKDALTMRVNGNIGSPVELFAELCARYNHFLHHCPNDFLEDEALDAQRIAIDAIMPLSLDRDIEGENEHFNTRAATARRAIIESKRWRIVNELGLSVAGLNDLQIDRAAVKDGALVDYETAGSVRVTADVPAYTLRMVTRMFARFKSTPCYYKVIGLHWTSVANNPSIMIDVLNSTYPGAQEDLPRLSGPCVAPYGNGTLFDSGEGLGDFGENVLWNQDDKAKLLTGDPQDYAEAKQAFTDAHLYGLRYVMFPRQLALAILFNDWRTAKNVQRAAQGLDPVNPRAQLIYYEKSPQHVQRYTTAATPQEASNPATALWQNVQNPNGPHGTVEHRAAYDLMWKDWVLDLSEDGQYGRLWQEDLDAAAKLGTKFIIFALDERGDDVDPFINANNWWGTRPRIWRDYIVPRLVSYSPPEV